ncbi:Hypothetical protein PHPALM_12141 [Phytophthora palmivora]|uniref:Uncharacterized protein n=1 Tax=Phytophthora palmivora TaxID=4796 RepID=A0A2P4Y0H7_9STRA|nr:Hypothetical protein PHPALM_12141 [Phytophthora palmivora]
MSKLEEFAGIEGDEGRVRAWLNKVKSAFVRDQTPTKKMSGIRRFPHRIGSKLPHTTQYLERLLRSFQIQYCGRGVSVARKYYHAHKRSDESSLEYLYRLNVAGSGPASRSRMDLRKFGESMWNISSRL